MKVGTRSTTCSTTHSFNMKYEDHTIIIIAALNTTANDNKVSAHDSRKGTDAENQQGVEHVSTDWHSGSGITLHEIEKRNKKALPQYERKPTRSGACQYSYSAIYYKCNLERRRRIHHAVMGINIPPHNRPYQESGNARLVNLVPEHAHVVVSRHNSTLGAILYFKSSWKVRTAIFL